MTLYELKEEYRLLLAMAEDPDTDPEVLKDTLEALTGEIEEKADGYAMVIRQLEADEAAIKNEEARLTARRLSIANNIRCMKLSLQAAMEATNKPKFKTTLFSFNIQKNPVSVVVDVPWTKLPEDYLKYRDPDIDKARIKKDLQAGLDIGVAHLVQTESLRIR